MLEFLKTIIIKRLLNQKTMDFFILRKGQVRNSKHNPLNTVILQCAVHTALEDDEANIIRTSGWPEPAQQGLVQEGVVEGVQQGVCEGEEAP